MAAPGKKDYYDILGVGRGASADEIKKAAAETGQSIASSPSAAAFRACMGTSP